MNERSVRIAISIKDRVVRQLACNMFSTAGASVEVYDDTAAILDAADPIQGIVLGLGAAPEETFDALVMLRQRLATIPIYVITDTAGEQRHAKRAKSFGATQVIVHELLQRRVGHLVQQVAQGSGIKDWGIRSPGWVVPKADQGYDIESMDLGAWLAIPGNRRLLGMQEPHTEAAMPAAGPAGQDERLGAGQTIPVQTPSTPPVTATEWIGVPQSPGSGPGVCAASERGEDQAPCHLTDCPLLTHCREEHDAQNAAILDAHKQREKRMQELNQAYRERLQVEIRHELNQTMTRQIAAAIRRMNLMVGALAGVVVLMSIGLVWRLGPW